MLALRCRPPTALRRLGHRVTVYSSPTTTSHQNLLLAFHHQQQPSSPAPIQTQQSRPSSSSGRWKQRQSADHLTRLAKVAGLRSRAAYKLLELNAQYHLFRPSQSGQVVVDLGFAPGSWSQVAADRVGPTGTVVGIDILPAQPPRGVSTFQGNFLDPGVQKMLKEFLVEEKENKKRRREIIDTDGEEEEGGKGAEELGVNEKGEEEGGGKADMVEVRKSYIDLEKDVVKGREEKEMQATKQQQQRQQQRKEEGGGEEEDEKRKMREKRSMRVVDVVLSDMMMNTSGLASRDHAGSMDLCRAALSFASDTLKTGGHFVCKFYQGSEDKDFEKLLKKMFAKVHREKPESSRSESKESFFVALRRKGDVTLEDIEVVVQ
ncbi:FtsJ-like methyltransferase-domain-containing protein [Cladorrhinum sp. PSN259]|nr:FtsJ-like methyltransferase-domain-containing protein [Cladorrhinum sp. PSN259]